ncbi:MAG: dihydrofolate reductase, partial [Oribacterium sp.]|nr:dihydrofolate reductase [Oribacterium sp.]
GVRRRMGDRMIAIIAAYADHRVIGYQGRIPWHISEDFRHFREITAGGTVIMGRKTYESIGHPLPGRENIIVSRSLSEALMGEGSAKALVAAESMRKSLDTSAKTPVAAAPAETDIRFARNLPEALDLATRNRIFIIGGESLYREGLAYADTLYLTEIDGSFPGDKHFPELPEGEFQLISSEQHKVNKAEKVERAEQVERVKQAEKAEGELTFRFLEYRR